MELNNYQEEAISLAIYPGRHYQMGLIYCALMLTGEAGEFSEHLGKALRDDQGNIEPYRRQLMIKELGDVLWYLAAAADELDITLDEVAKINLDKLKDRKSRGVLAGYGDNR